jgi:hypothetical protein
MGAGPARGRPPPAVSSARPCPGRLGRVTLGRPPLRAAAEAAGVRRPPPSAAPAPANMNLFKADLEVRCEAGLGGSDVAAHSSPIEEEPTT